MCEPISTDVLTEIMNTVTSVTDEVDYYQQITRTWGVSKNFPLGRYSAS